MDDDREPPPDDGDPVNLASDQSDSEDIFGDSSNKPKLVPIVDHEPAKPKQQDRVIASGGDGPTVAASPGGSGHTSGSTASAAPAKAIATADPVPTKPSVSPPASSAPASSSTFEKAAEAPSKPRSSAASSGANGSGAAEEEDKFNVDIKVTNPQKKGEGMSAYMIYQVNTTTNIPAFRKTQLSVSRRFSDFLGLYEKLVAKHQHLGRLVPRPPEKSVVGMTKVKMSKDESSSGQTDFVEKRRAALERFLNHTASHPLLRMDPDFRDFLELDADLPKATSTSALSGAGVMRLFSKVGDAVSKMSFTMMETDQWFEEKALQMENLDVTLKRLYANAEILVGRRQELGESTAAFAKSCAALAGTEEHASLSTALTRLAELEEKVQQLYDEQADSDFFTFAELLKDYIGQVAAVKDVLAERIKKFKQWKDCEHVLLRKQEAKAKLEAAAKADKIPQAASEVTEAEEKVKDAREEFETISETIRKEVARFDRKRVKDFVTTVLNYLEKLMNNQDELVKYWEAFLPEAKAIA